MEIYQTCQWRNYNLGTQQKGFALKKINEKQIICLGFFLAEQVATR